MDSVTVIKVCEKHKKLVDSYFENDGKILYNMIDKILFRLKYLVWCFEKTHFFGILLYKSIRTLLLLNNGILPLES